MHGPRPREPLPLKRLLFAAIALVLAGSGLGAQGGTASGIVTDSATGKPVAQARVLVTGTTIGTMTGDDGRYTLRGIPTGPRAIEYSRIGFAPKTITLTISGGTPANQDVALGAAIFSLNAVVTTATGDQRKVELANSTTQIAVATQLQDLPVSNMGSLLSGRASSVQVMSTGATGTGSRIRIRGQNSFSLSNDPIVIIDGIRANSSTTNGIGVGGSGPSRLDDLNPNEIENIEVIKGPSAATLYGTEAANGVIVVKTKRGRAGATRYNISMEAGQIENTAKYPDMWSLWGKTGTSTVSNICLLTATVAATPCVVDSLSHGNVLHDPRLTPIGSGDRRQYSLQLTGGTDNLQYFVSGQTEDEVGVYKMPDIEVPRLLTRRGVGVLPSDQMRPNTLRRNSLRVNLSTRLSSNLSIQTSSAYINSDGRLPQNEDNSNGLMVAALGGTWRGDLLDAQGDSLRGYRSFMMGDVLAQVTSQNINRFINSINAQFTPTSWLSLRSSVGSDYTLRNDLNLTKVGEGVNAGTLRTGNIQSTRADNNQVSVDISGTATFQPMTWLTSKTSFGQQYVRVASGNTTGTGIGLPPGGVTVSAAATRSSTQTLSENRTLGYFVEQQLALYDKLFITGGIRRDGASAFGKQSKEVYYPKFGASWMISQYEWFKTPSWLNLTSLRLRGTYGASGQIPGATDAVKFFSARPTTLASGDTPGASLGSLGNSKLKPEFSAETEFGFDATLYNGWANIELTSYNKKTRDALISRDIAPSLSGLTSQFVNVGSIQNTGIEFSWTQRVLDRREVAFEFSLTGSTNKNKMLTLGEGILPIPSGNRSTQRNLPNYPLYGLWDKKITFNDANKDGVIVNSEMTFGDTAIFQGNIFPTHEMAFSPAVEVFNHRLRLSAQIDRKWGMVKFNNTLRHQCMNGVSCRGRYDKSVPLYEQANALATAQSVFTGMFEDGSFARLREVSASFTMPAEWARMIRASSWTVVLTGRNLGVWSKYSGVDPEAAASTTDTRGNEEYFATPPLRYMTLRFNLGY
jgi:TonB-linked SusC/RagA family outer membrane protein